MRTTLLATFVVLFMAKTHAQCGCWLEPDSSYTTITNNMWYIPSNTQTSTTPPDDGTFGPITLPFNFQFLGVDADTVFINTNGLLSFDFADITFNANAFPATWVRFIAPFWSDVDLRGSCVDCNRVSYKLTPTALFVSWHRVGYWSAQTDLLNSFQVIITDGTDPVIPGGNNVSFCYGNMQWATSDGNSGANGSGGIPATVGVNQATGADVSYAQVGRFRELGMNYDGPYGEGSGVDWLDSAHFVFSTADPVGVSPIFAWQSDCDTISLMVGDELEYDMLVLAGGPGQSVSVLSECTTVQSYTELSNTQGAQALVTSFMAPDEADIGFHTITYVAQNDSTNPTSATGTLVVQVVPDITTGISDHAEGRLSVFPNPVESVLRYTIDRDAQDRFLQILTMDGRLIRQLATLPGAYTGTIDVHDLAPGTYFLRNGSFAMRFMKD